MIPGTAPGSLFYTNLISDIFAKMPPPKSGAAKLSNRIYPATALLISSIAARIAGS